MYDITFILSSKVSLGTLNVAAALHIAISLSLLQKSRHHLSTACDTASQPFLVARTLVTLVNQ